MRKNYWLLVLCIYFPLNLFARDIGPWDLDSLYQVPVWDTTSVASSDGLTGIIYESLDYNGAPAKVFAYYGVPDGSMPDGGWPAVVYVHGGGGTASADWVQSWNDHGYAAISMDLEGHYPIGSYGNRPSTENPGPERIGNFNDWQLPVEEQWYYHAAAQVITGHSLLRSFPEVNADKTGMVGVSWGGILLSTVMGIDSRSKWAIPVYGCGYLSEMDTYMGASLQDDAKADFVNTNYDGSAYFNNVTCPTLWINGTNDIHFAMTGNQKSFQAVQGPAILRFTLRMPHGDGPARLFEELYAFADHVIRGTGALPVMGAPVAESNTGSVSFRSDFTVSGAQLLYTLDYGTWSDRYWYETSAAISGDTISAEIPEDATTIYFTATDSRGLMVSSEYLEFEKPPVTNGNLALSGTATQSSVDYGGEPERAIDGDTNGKYGGGSVTHTAAEDNPWWQVDLGAVMIIDSITIWNRTDVYNDTSNMAERLSNFTIQIIYNLDSTVFTDTIVDSFPDPTYTTITSGIHGRYVKVQLTEFGVLSLAEVQVFGKNPTNIDVDPGSNAQTPEKFTLYQNYPNPFNPNTRIQFNLPEAAEVDLTVYDIQGRKIKTMIQGSVNAGIHSIEWNATNDLGQGVPSGTYFYRIKVTGKNLNIAETGKMILMK